MKSKVALIIFAIAALTVALYERHAAATVGLDYCRLAFYRQANGLVTRVGQTIYFGDSITEFWPGRGKDPGTLNRAIRGQDTTELLGRFRQDVILLQPKTVVVLAGTNDVLKGISATTVYNNLLDMVELADVTKLRSSFVPFPRCDMIAISEPDKQTRCCL